MEATYRLFLVWQVFIGIIIIIIRFIILTFALRPYITKHISLHLLFLFPLLFLLLFNSFTILILLFKVFINLRQFLLPFGLLIPSWTRSPYIFIWIRFVVFFAGLIRFLFNSALILLSRFDFTFVFWRYHWDAFVVPLLFWFFLLYVFIFEHIEMIPLRLCKLLRIITNHD